MQSCDLAFHLPHAALDRRGSLAMASGVGYTPIMKPKTPGTRTASYTVVFEKEPEGGYTVLVPALPGVVTCGSTLKEARAMAEDAIRGYIESLLKDGEPVPVEEEVDVERMDVEVPAA